MRKGKRSAKRNFRLVFIFSVAGILLAAILIVLLLAYIFNITGLITLEIIEELGWFIVLIFACSSVLIGLFLAFCFGKIIMQPINKIVDGMTKLSEGDYNVRIDLGKHSAMKEMSERFNKLAIELEKNEMLSSDFINNFSHEFKTPIASISGLVSLMKNSKLPENKRLEYLSIIEDETRRLSQMTTNVLNLSKLENQEILKDKVKFNLSEQIRTCVLLLEKKWLEKELELNLDFDEIDIVGNEDLLKQVWFNLIDNAIKFAYPKTELKIEINQENNLISVGVSNHGPTISEENSEKIFNKFYQVDKTHSKEGNGIGLSLAEHIVDLHEGMIYVESANELTKFIVELPKTLL